MVKICFWFFWLFLQKEPWKMPSFSDHLLADAQGVTGLLGRHKPSQEDITTSRSPQLTFKVPPSLFSGRILIPASLRVEPTVGS